MKILHINDFASPDYMNDIVFHGGKTTLGDGYETTSPADYMYSDWPRKQSLYGRGFTLYCRLDRPRSEPTEAEVVEKIRSRFYDRVIFGSVHRWQPHIDLVSRHYRRSEVAFIDGEDEDHIVWPATTVGVYFKRELPKPHELLLPIGFGVPKEIFRRNVPKTQILASTMPNFRKDYAFTDEDQYHMEYARSHIAVTTKKNGWDALRHYEIVANFCMPHFPKLESCPLSTLSHFPKDEVVRYNSSFGMALPASAECWLQAMESIWVHCLGNCTTEAIFGYVMGKLG